MGHAPIMVHNPGIGPDREMEQAILGVDDHRCQYLLPIVSMKTILFSTSMVLNLEKSDFVRENASIKFLVGTILYHLVQHMR